MNLNINNRASLPIYEQLKVRIKQNIVSSVLEADEQMPSMRQLSKDLNVGMVTVKRAYDDLVSEGYLYTVPAKGVYVAKLDLASIKSHYISKIEKGLDEILFIASEARIEEQELRDLVMEYLREKQYEN